MYEGITCSCRETLTDVQCSTFSFHVVYTCCLFSLPGKFHCTISNMCRWEDHKTKEGMSHLNLSLYTHPQLNSCYSCDCSAKDRPTIRCVPNTIPSSNPIRVCHSENRNVVVTKSVPFQLKVGHKDAIVS